MKRTFERKILQQAKVTTTAVIMLVALFTLTACTKSQAEQGAALNQVSKIILPLVVVPVLIGLLRKARKRKDDNLYSLIKMLLWLLALAYPIVLLAPSHI